MRVYRPTVLKCPQFLPVFNIYRISCIQTTHAGYLALKIEFPKFAYTQHALHVMTDVDDSSDNIHFVSCCVSFDHENILLSFPLTNYFSGLYLKTCDHEVANAFNICIIILFLHGMVSCLLQLHVEVF